MPRTRMWSIYWYFLGIIFTGWTIWTSCRYKWYKFFILHYNISSFLKLILILMGNIIAETCWHECWYHSFMCTHGWQVCLRENLQTFIENDVFLFYLEFCLELISVNCLVAVHQTMDWWKLIKPDELYSLQKNLRDQI